MTEAKVIEETPLHFAAKNGHQDAVKVLVESGGVERTWASTYAIQGNVFFRVFFCKSSLRSVQLEVSVLSLSKV